MSGDFDAFAGLAVEKSDGIGVGIITCILIYICTATFEYLHR